MKLRDCAILLCLALCATACGGGGGGGTGGKTGEEGIVRASGRLSLIGPDASFLGSSVEITDVALEFPPGAGDARTLVFVDRGTGIMGSGIVEDVSQIDFDPIDVLNSLILVVLDEPASGISGVSMAMVRGGQTGRYSCTNGPGTGDDCGNLIVDHANGTVTFDMVQVEFDPDDQATADLILDGVLTWTIED